MSILHTRIPRDYSDPVEREYLFQESGDGGIEPAALPVYAFQPMQAFTQSPEGGMQMVLAEIGSDPVWEESVAGGIQPRT